MKGAVFDVLLIRHTLEVTTVSKAGDFVNFEVDTMARYAARLAKFPAPRRDGRVTRAGAVPHRGMLAAKTIAAGNDMDTFPAPDIPHRIAGDRAEWRLTTTLYCWRSGLRVSACRQHFSPPGFRRVSSGSFCPGPSGSVASCRRWRSIVTTSMIRALSSDASPVLQFLGFSFIYGAAYRFRTGWSARRRILALFSVCIAVALPPFAAGYDGIAFIALNLTCLPQALLRQPRNIGGAVRRRRPHDGYRHPLPADGCLVPALRRRAHP